MSARILPAALLLAQFLYLPCAASAAEPPLATSWKQAESSRVRLVAGRVDAEGAAARLVAGVEIEMVDDWKTYWRNPGSSGVPPNVDWSKSSNLASARLLFPAPKRFVDRDGDTIGYKGAVVLPIELTAKDASKPVELVVGTEYGICKDICIPVELSFSLSVPPDAKELPGASRLARALARVPRPAAARTPADPALIRVASHLGGDKPRILIETSFPGGTGGADLFIEAPDGLWLPLPRKTAVSSDNAVTFEIDLTDGVDIRDLAGKTLRATLVSDAGQSEASFQVQ